MFEGKLRECRGTALVAPDAQLVNRRRPAQAEWRSVTATRRALLGLRGRRGLLRTAQRVGQDERPVPLTLDVQERHLVLVPPVLYHLDDLQ
jgi:hypothetical protein